MIKNLLMLGSMEVLDNNLKTNYGKKYIHFQLVIPIISIYVDQTMVFR
jgi:hypothetical protein